MRAKIMAWVVLAAFPAATRGTELFEIAAMRALPQDDRHGRAVSFSWRRSPESAFGVEWAEYAEGGGTMRRDLGLRWSAINPEPLWRPSFEIGIGRATGAARQPAWMATVGVGGRWALLEDGRGLQLAAEIRYRREERRTPGERGPIALIGLAVPLGGEDTAPFR